MSLLSCSWLIPFTERIVDFHSDITIFPDAQLRVTETISYALPAGKRGICRDFPTRYVDYQHHYKQVVDFSVEQVVKDGKAVPFTVTDHENGKRIRIGSPSVYLSQGVHTYQITYTTARQLGFFAKWDELYWNVTGNRWSVPIEHASATVRLPVESLPIFFEGIAFTGYRGERGTQYRVESKNPATLFWETTQRILPGQGLTIVARWPKGIIHEPSFMTKLRYFITDNALIMWLTLMLTILIGYCFWSWRRIHATQTNQTIIPLFYPPANMSPGEIRYVTQCGYDATTFAAEILNMAVHGFLTIESQKHFLSTTYILKKSYKKDSKLAPIYQPLVSVLFKKSDTVIVNKKNQEVLSAAINYVKDTLLTPLNGYFADRFDQLMKAGIILMVGGVGALALYEELYFAFIILAGLIAGITTMFYYYGIRGYTSEGLRIKRDIEGFKFFLETTEGERLKIIGTPPTKTPELYEKYLPYAVALGVEKQWSQQFAPIFRDMELKGHPYRPIWFIGDWHNFGSHSFASDLGNSLTSTINASIPGSSSGFGGGGSSGGGGGGGGGGSW